MPKKALQFASSLFLISIVGVNLLFPSLVSAQIFGSEIAYTYDVTDTEAIDGDIMSNTPQGIARSSSTYDPQMFGVLDEAALLSYRRVDQTGEPIVRNGIVSVNVTTLNGPVLRGDYISSSPITGKGQKATEAGYSIGIALSSLEAGGEKTTFQGQEFDTGKVQVALRIEYAEPSNPQTIGRIFNFLGTSLFTNVQDPQRFGQVMRFLAAAMVVLLTFGFSFITFSRSMGKGMEAIGRNPLAKSTIQMSMAINAGLVIITAGAGIVAAILILRT